MENDAGQKAPIVNGNSVIKEEPELEKAKSTENSMIFLTAKAGV